MAFSVTINGVDRTTDVLAGSIVIEDVINDEQNECSLSLIDLSETGVPETDQEIIIVDDAGTTVFGGYIITVDLDDKTETGNVVANLSCVDYVWLLDRNLVHKTYEDMTDAAIIADIVNTYCPGTDITTTNVIEGVTIDQIAFNYIQPSQCLRQLCDLTGRNWYIDYEKDLHYFPLATTTAPFDIDDTTTTYSNFLLSKDASQIKNRVYVRGGTKISDPTVYAELGDGEKRVFVLPDKPRDVSVTVNGDAKTVGIKHIDLSGFDWYVNYQEKYLEQDTGGTTLTTSDTIEITYSYDIPILVAIENTASIIEHGQKEFAIFDKQIRTTQAARDRASAELTDYANDIVEASFITHTAGFVSGQYIHVNLTAYDVDADYIVQKVTSRSMGAGLFEYRVKLASAKTMGIIRFLIELLEANKNLIELDDNESIDELVTIADQFLSDSLTDSLTIDSAGAYATWCVDSTDDSPSTRMRWDLFQWG